MTITTTAQTILVTDVSSVTVTLPVLDTETGDYVREIRVTTPGGGEAGPTQSFTLRLAAAQRSNLDITAPEQPF